MASCPAEAFEIVRNETVHLVLSDIEMPGENGLQLLSRIKEYDVRIST